MAKKNGIIIADKEFNEKDNLILCAENVEKNYGSLHVLKGVTLDVKKGEVIAIIGPSDNRLKPDWHINIECENEIQQLFANVVILQLLALETALELKRNVDSPKGLHKVVVEKL